MPSYNIANFDTDNVSTSINNVVNSTKESFENFLKECLNPYGITTHSDMGRVSIVSFYDNPSGKPITNENRYRIYIDKNYKFTIVNTADAIVSENGSWTYKVGYKKTVEEDVK